MNRVSADRWVSHQRISCRTHRDAAAEGLAITTSHRDRVSLSSISRHRWGLAPRLVSSRNNFRLLGRYQGRSKSCKAFWKAFATSLSQAWL
jgi:hypothetical protein